jgi:hypothetical protein
MSPVPLNLYVQGARDVVRCEIEELPDGLVAVLVWDTGHRQNVDRYDSWHYEMIEDAWDAAVLDVAKPEKYRRRALYARLQWAADSERELRRYDD